MPYNEFVEPLSELIIEMRKKGEDRNSENSSFHSNEMLFFDQSNTTMKKTIRTILSTAILAALHACSSEETSMIINPKDEVNFQVEQSNTSTDFNSQAQQLTSKEKSSSWRHSANGKITLTKEVSFDLTLENGTQMSFGFWFIKHEANTALLILDDEGASSWGRNWNYSSTELEAEHFYQGFDEARVLINGNVIFHDSMNDHFDVAKVEPAIVDGEEKSYVTISFDGEAFGFYDPLGEYQAVYNISNGEFRGIIE